MEGEESLQKLCRSSRKEVDDVKEGSILEYISGVKEELIERKANDSATFLKSPELVNKTMKWVNSVVSTNSNGEDDDDDDDDDDKRIRNYNGQWQKRSSNSSNNTAKSRENKNINIGYKQQKEAKDGEIREEDKVGKVSIVEQSEEDQSDLTNKAFWSMVQNYARRAQMKPRLLERMKIVQGSHDTLVERTAELVTQRSFYKDYLVQVKSGKKAAVSSANSSKSSMQGTSTSTIAAEEKKKKTFSLNVLMALGVIVQAEDDADENEFHFTCIARGNYVIKKYYKGGFGFLRSKILQSFRKRRFVASFSNKDLTRIQEKGERFYNAIDGVKFDVKKLEQFLRRTFGI